MAGSMDRCETATTNCPGPGSGTGSVVSDQSVARGSPDGRAASRTWWLIDMGGSSGRDNSPAAYRSEHALGAGDSVHPRVTLAGVAQRPGQRLELRLDDVVRVAAVRYVQVDADLRLGGERLQDVPGQGGIELAHERGHPGRLAMHDIGPPGQVDGGLGQRFVQRDRGVPEPAQARLVAQGDRERLAERQRGVLDRVVRVDVQVPVGPHREVEQAVLAELAEHVVEEPDARRDVDLPGAVDVDVDHDRGFLGLPLDVPGAAAAHPDPPSLVEVVCLMRKFALCKNPRRLLPVRPAPTARAGPEGLHSRPVLHNAQSVYSRATC